MITFRHKGDFKFTEKLFLGYKSKNYLKPLNALGERGVIALREATPKDTGKTSQSWSYEIIEEEGSVSIYWTNSNVSPWNPHVNIAVILQYGHATRHGKGKKAGWVEGRDYINPAIQPIFDQIANEAWEVIVGR